MGIFEALFKKKINKLKTETKNQVINNINTIIKNNNKKPRNYNRSSFGSAFSGGSKWLNGLSSSGNSMYIDHRTLSLNSRKAVWDSIQAKAMVDRFAETVVDIGLKIESMPKFSILGITAEQAEAWGEDASERFDLFAKSKKQHRAGLYNLYQAQLMYGKFQQRDNDIFVRLFYSAKKTLLNPLQFEFIDPLQIRGYSYTNTDYQLTCEDGIIRNPDGTEKAYNVWIQKPGTYEFEDKTIPAIGPKSGKTMMLHGFQPEYAGQGRGYSRLGHALQEFQNITDFSLSTIKKAINQSSFVFSIENQQQDPSGAGFESYMTNRGAGPAKEQPVVENENDTGTIIDDGERFTYQEAPEMTLTDPGSVGMIGLQQGDSMRLHPTPGTGDTYESFLNTYVSYICASTGMSIEILLMKFNASYSASRAALVIFWRIAGIWRGEMISDWLDPLYESWLSEEIAAGRIKAPGWSDPVLRAAWLSNSWIGAPMPNIDPAREAKAAKEYLDISATTQNRIARNLNGSAAKDNIAINKRMFPETPKTPWGQTEATNEDGDGEEKEMEEK